MGLLIKHKRAKSLKCLCPLSHMYNQDTRATKYDMSMSGTQGKSDKKAKCKYPYEMFEI